jgi:hypothetical protein
MPETKLRTESAARFTLIVPSRKQFIAGWGIRWQPCQYLCKRLRRFYFEISVSLTFAVPLRCRPICFAAA